MLTIFENTLFYKRLGQMEIFNTLSNYNGVYVYNEKNMLQMTTNCT